MTSLRYPTVLTHLSDRRRPHVAVTGAVIATTPTVTYNHVAFYDGVAHPHVFGHISPPFAFQKLGLSHKRGNALSYHLSS